ncbi:class I tRNA ligase family protein [Streptantibioticus ferralitis]|uniref:Class I tRNA ligase family protein n=1 Tax=Streptantibioticus ferralitis TaxID=236510 RepID=A0ABT5YVD0_9ACTN|nr:class I tRNA ligase family protein [Streptantibioticus ferralitis]MDF2255509.1 class I tRNA ligase family protein [Streptantibioticus ferralitis]
MRSTIVLVLRDPESPESNLRSEALGSYLRRLRVIEGKSATVATDATGSRQAVTLLAEAATLIGDGGEVRYVPTRAARDRVAGDGDGAWLQSMVSRHRKLVRRSVGAIFEFPLEAEARAGGDEPASLRTFVTDWTGLPSSCAVAVHPGHPLSTGLGPGEHASFTGRFCRHPLTGDLLPIWVGDWVKPEFGTGAVLLNPGHNLPDLEFSRKVGLPVRFSLAPKGHDGAPVDWVKPPYIKSGHAYRVGPAAEGLPFDEAKTVYFAAVAERGLVEEYTDSGMGTFRVASVGSDGGVEVPWDQRRRTVARDDASGEPVRLCLSPVLSVVEEHVRSAELTVVTPSTRVEDDLLALRLLLAEPDIAPVVKTAPEVVVVGNAQLAKGTDPATSEEVLRLALLVSAAPLDMLSVKPQHIEPCERFLAVHATVSAREPADGQERSGEVSKAAGQIKGLLGRQDLKQAFTQMYRLQKTLAKAEGLGEADAVCYAALAHVLAGVETPFDQAALNSAWESI